MIQFESRYYKHTMTVYRNSRNSKSADLKFTILEQVLLRV